MSEQTNTTTTVGASTISPKKFRSNKQKRVLFYCLVIALPLLQFIIFYVTVNLNSILLAFSEVSLNDTGRLQTTYFGAGFENFKTAFDKMFNNTSNPIGQILANSALVLATDILISLPLAVLFSFYIYKNFFGSKVFKVALFLPQIVSVMIFCALFRYLSADVLTLIPGLEEGWIKNPDWGIRMSGILFYNIWISFGVNVIMITGAMSSINQSLVEACHLDGANTIQEFWHVTLPMIWPTFTTFVVISLTGFFVNQLNLYGLFSIGAPAGTWTFGYVLFVEGQSAGPTYGSTVGMWGMNYQELSATGLVVTLILLPIVLGTRELMRRLGPSVD